MPWNDGSADHLVEYISVLGCLQSLLDRHIGSLFICGGDFNVEKNIALISLMKPCSYFAVLIICAGLNP